MKQVQDNFYKPSVSVDIVVFTIEDNTLKVVTIKRADEPFKNCRALPGGFLKHGETTLKAVERILEDKVGLKNIYLEQLYTFDDLDRDPRGPVISVSYFALIPRQKLSIKETRLTQDPELTPVKSVGKLAFDHAKILKKAHDRIRTKLEYSNIALSFLPPKFTLTELQNIYETVFVRVLDKRNFRKKIKRLNLIKPTKEKVGRGRQRPALLYVPATKGTQIFKDMF